MSFKDKNRKDRWLKIVLKMKILFRKLMLSINQWFGSFSKSEEAVWVFWF